VFLFQNISEFCSSPILVDASMSAELDHEQSSARFLPNDGMHVYVPQYEYAVGGSDGARQIEVIFASSTIARNKLVMELHVLPTDTSTGALDNGWRARNSAVATCAIPPDCQYYVGHFDSSLITQCGRYVVLLVRADSITKCSMPFRIYNATVEPPANILWDTSNLGAYRCLEFAAMYPARKVRSISVGHVYNHPFTALATDDGQVCYAEHCTACFCCCCCCCATKLQTIGGTIGACVLSRCTLGAPTIMVNLVVCIV
jgi:hypothetical protein